MTPEGSEFVRVKDKYPERKQMNLDCYQTLTTVVVGQMVGTRLSVGQKALAKFHSSLLPGKDPPLVLGS
jgi:hypothetical protein